MGANAATLDFLDIEKDTLYRNIYPTRNPEVVKELGDVGNDLQIYGSKLYAVINCSNKIEVMDLQGRRIRQVDIPNCRSICFHEGFAYVTSYAGPVQIDPNYKQRGYIAKIDTATLTVVDTCHVGYQPNGIATDGIHLYAANSGGYMYPNYDSTVSVVPLSSFRESHRITVALNLDQLVYSPVDDALYVTSLGDYYAHPACLYRIGLDIDSKENAPTYSVTSLGFPASYLSLSGDCLYYFAASYSASGVSFGRYCVRTQEQETLPIPNASSMENPSAIWTEPITGDIYIGDALSYTVPGVLYHYAQDGTLISQFRTGDIPAHVAFKAQ